MKKILAILVAALFCCSCVEEILPDTDMYSVKYEYNAHWGGDLNLNMDYTFQFTDEYGVLGGVSYGDTDTHITTVSPLHYNDVVTARIRYNEAMYDDVVTEIKVYVSKNGGPYMWETTSDSGEITYKIQ